MFGHWKELQQKIYLYNIKNNSNDIAHKLSFLNWLDKIPNCWQYVFFTKTF